MRVLVTIAVLAAPLLAASYQYQVLATNKTSTMEREMNQSASAGYLFSAVMGGDTATAGNQVVVIMTKGPSEEKASYRLLATNKTSTMQKELQKLGDEGYEYRGQTIFESTFGGKEVCVILERKPSAKPLEYRLLATSKTSTMEKELAEAGAQGFQLVGMTVAKTAFGGNELVSILARGAE